MGCYNKTCGISNLYINDGEPVYTFVLVQNSSEERCYNTSFYRPELVPFECTYDDYGGGEKAHGVALTPLLAAITEKCRVNDDVIDELDIDAFFELVHDQEITYKNYCGKSVLVDFVMMRKDIVDHVLANWYRSVWDTNEDSGWHHYTYQDVIKEIPEFIDVLATEIQKWQDLDDPTHSIMYSMFTLKTGNSFMSQFNSSPDRCNLVAIALQHDIHTQLFSPNEHIISLIVQNKIEEVTAFITDYVKGTFVNCLIDSVRKQWIPGCHEGSQSCDHDGYRRLIDATVTVLNKKEVEYEEE